jgi:hypothetical protein
MGKVTMSGAFSQNRRRFCFCLPFRSKTHSEKPLDSCIESPARVHYNCAGRAHPATLALPPFFTPTRQGARTS